MNNARDDVVVERNVKASRYEVHAGGTLSVLEYRRDGERVMFTHTGVPAELEGRGIAGALAQAALDDARTEGLEVIPLCPFVAAYIRRHPAYLDLVPAPYRGRLEGGPDRG